MQHDWYERNKERHQERVRVARPTIEKAVRARNRAIMDAAKAGPCDDCGRRFPSEQMDFDHVRGEKLRNVSAMLNAGLPQLLAEIAKCDVVCANCHRVRTRAPRNGFD